MNLIETERCETLMKNLHLFFHFLQFLCVQNLISLNFFSKKLFERKYINNCVMYCNLLFVCVMYYCMYNVFYFHMPAFDGGGSECDS